MALRKHFVVRYVVLAAALAVCTAAAAQAKPPLAGRDVQTGRFVALSHYAGKPVFVNVWGSWCVACNTEARTLASFARAHRGQVAFLGIDTEDSRTGARAFYARHGRAYPSIWDPKALLAGAWTRGTPTTLVFDRKHRLVRRIEGAVSLAQLKAALRRVTRP